MNRGNRRAMVFHDEGDYLTFQDLLLAAQQRVRVRILAWALMPNHFHLVVQPDRDGGLGRFMHWLLTTHVQRHRIRHGTVGRIWQGRFKALPIQQDHHLLSVVRYVEANPLRAGLVARAEAWPFGSLRARVARDEGLLSASPVALPEDWLELVNTRLADDEIEAIRESTRRQRPFGDPAWTRGTAERLDLLSSLAPHGRPPIVPTELL